LRTDGNDNEDQADPGDEAQQHNSGALRRGRVHVHADIRVEATT
jgi:hypothetical protein